MVNAFFARNIVAIMSKHSEYSNYQESYWGTESMTRLLRVSRQVHDEALPVLYSRFTFGWPDFSDTKHVHEVLDPMRPVARRSIRNVAFLPIISSKTTDLPECEQHLKRHKDAWALIKKELPNIRSVHLQAYPIFQLQKWRARRAVSAVVDLMSVFKGVWRIKVDEFLYDWDKSKRLVIMEIRRRVEDGLWTEEDAEKVGGILMLGDQRYLNFED